MGERLKEAGNLLLGILIFIAILAILALVIVGPEWLSERLLPWFVRASVLAFALLILVLLPLSAFGRSRPFASVAILMVSYVFGGTVWMEGLLSYKIAYLAQNGVPGDQPHVPTAPSGPKEAKREPIG